MSKVLSNAGVPTAVNPEDVLAERYENNMKIYKDGLDQNVWDNGSVEEKKAFTEAMFGARVDGVSLHQLDGKSRDIPSIGIGDEDFEFGIEQSTLPQPGAFKETYQAIELKPARSSRYEQALNALGDIGNADGKEDAGLDY